MARWLGALSAWLVIAGLSLLATGCGASEPREEDIFHDPSLRASHVQPADDTERAVLRELAGHPGEEAVEVGGQTVRLERPYHAASGRRCRAVALGEARRLACEYPEGWAFVPSVGTEP